MTAIYSLIRRAGGVCTVLMVGILSLPASASSGTALSSGFGSYSDTEGALYKEYTRRSLYVSVKDGTKLAVDVFLPAIDGSPVSSPLPTIFYYGRYWRAREMADGTIVTNLGPWKKGQKVAELKHRDESGRLMFWDTGRESIVDMMRRGYAFVRAESRGTGASGGIRDGEHSRTEAKDGADLINWITEQKWSNGKVGMMGGSYPGMTQLKVAALAPDGLKAIFPVVPSFDFYQLVTGGSGLLHKGILSFGEGQAAKDGLTKSTSKSGPVAVDADTDGSMLEAILVERRANSPQHVMVNTMLETAPEFTYAIGELSEALEHDSFMDTLGLIMSPPHLQQALAGNPELQEKFTKGLHVYRDTPAFSADRPKGMVSPHVVLDAINASGIPTYIWTAWYDQDTLGAFNLFASLTVPKRITAGTWSHGPNEDNGIDDHPFDAYEAQGRELLNAEAIRWFDFWLKGIDNGMMDEDAVHYSYPVSPTELKWQSSEGWPVKAGNTDFYLTPIQAVKDDINDGTLSLSGAPESLLSFTVDYTKTMGPQTRVHDSTSGVPAMRYPDLVSHAAGEGALTFTSEPLQDDMLILGSPVLTLKASSTAMDGDIFAYLEEVDADGNILYLTEGVIKASHRTLKSLPYEDLGLPFSASDRASVSQIKPFNEGLATLAFTMQPTANLFEKGHSIRLVITGGDMHNYVSPVFSPSPTVTIETGVDSSSVLQLPVVRH